MKLFRIAVEVFSLLLIFVGVVTAITPIPFGLPLILIGFLMLATASPATLRVIRRRWRWLDRRLKWLQEKLPGKMTDALRRTDPDDHDAEKEDGKKEQEDDEDLRQYFALRELRD